MQEMLGASHTDIWGAIVALLTIFGGLVKWLQARDARTDNVVAVIGKELHDLKDKLPEIYARRDSVERMEERIVSEVRGVRDDVSNMVKIIVDSLAKK